MRYRIVVLITCMLLALALTGALVLAVGGSGEGTSVTPRPGTPGSGGMPGTTSQTTGSRVGPALSWSGSVGIAAANGFIYVLDAGTVYKLDADTLAVVKTAQYKAPAAPAGGNTHTRSGPPPADE
jgi:hypothetical protein